MIHAYPRARYITSVLGQDLLLASLLVVFVLFRPTNAFVLPLAIGAAVVLGWGIMTLHFPSRIELDENGVAFFGYGRAHRFAWNDVKRVRIRRFLVKDRVLVRLAPAPAWRGRYWIVEGLEGFDALVAELEKRAKATATPIAGDRAGSTAARLPR